VLNPHAHPGDEFDTWVATSFVCVGLAHIAGALSGAVRAVQLARGKPAWSPARVFWITVGASSLPVGMVITPMFLVVVIFPPCLVAITGVPFLFILYAMERIAKRERLALKGISMNLPIAIARNT
jgi:hypothetical protein